MKPKERNDSSSNSSSGARHSSRSEKEKSDDTPRTERRRRESFGHDKEGKEETESKSKSTDSTTTTTTTTTAPTVELTLEEKVKQVESYVKNKLIDAARRRVRSRLESALFEFLGKWEPPPPPPEAEVPTAPTSPTAAAAPTSPVVKPLASTPGARLHIPKKEKKPKEPGQEGKKRTKEEKIKLREEKAQKREAKRLKREKRERKRLKQEARAKLAAAQANGEHVEGAEKAQDSDDEGILGENDDNRQEEEEEGAVEDSDSEDEEGRGNELEDPEDIEMPPNPSGCARCEPWEEARPRLQEWRRRRARLDEAAAVAAARAADSEYIEKGVQFWGPSVFLGGGIPDESVLSGTSTRAARNSKRKLQTTHLAQITDDADANLVNQLQRRHKSIRIFNSAIHNRGVFAEVPIEAGEVVVEYLGELVRQIVADRREEAYFKVGIDCSYMFRLGKSWIIDATMRGGLARFFNHSCDPNCYAREITHCNTQRIVIYARKAIVKGEELTYDYKFPLEDVKIPCRCGAKNCRGTLN